MHNLIIYQCTHLFRSVHNIRIERLWVDVTAQVGAKWADFFSTLELHHGLDINDSFHIWLLHHLFLPEINQELSFFVDSWNQHKITMRNGPSRSPADMFGFDMIVHGVRGDPLNDAMGDEELEVYGVDWEALRDDSVRAMHAANNPITEGWTSWIGRSGPPEHLNEVVLEAPEIDDGEAMLVAALAPLLPAVGEGLMVGTDMDRLTTRWITGLAIASITL